MRQRQHYEFDDFVRSLGREPDIAQEIWNTLSREAVVTGFKPKPEDDLLKVFGLADDDLDEIVLRILERCGCRVPAPAETEHLPPVRTVEDLFAFVVAMRHTGRE
ncbi:MAG TPA: hypothetical protein VHG93_23010 [Longimicrobium sp.]|nr:hypothetical protein [Longimicrobium sp.]